MHSQKVSIASAVLLVAIWFPGLCVGGGGGSGEIVVAEPIEITRLYCDPNGESRFADEKLPFTLIDFAPPAPPISVTEVLAAKSVAIISSPPGWHGDWHPAPAKQLMFVLSGELEVEVTSGEIRQFASGAAILVEDVACRGHVSRVVGADRLFMANIPLSVE